MAATTSGTAKVTLPTDEQILITREFNAPRHLVYKAYTTPELVKRWWAGRRGTVTQRRDRPPGRRRVALRDGGDGGFEVAFHGEFREVVPDERLVLTEVYEMPGAEPLPAADEPLNIVTFTEADGRTTLEVLVQTTSQELRDQIVNSGMEAGMQEGFDLLEQVAVSLSPAGTPAG